MAGIEEILIKNLEVFNQQIDHRITRLENKIDEVSSKLEERINELEKFEVALKAESRARAKIMTAILTLLSIISGFIGGLLTSQGGFK